MYAHHVYFDQLALYTHFGYCYKSKTCTEHSGQMYEEQEYQQNTSLAHAVGITCNLRWWCFLLPTSTFTNVHTWLATCTHACTHTHTHTQTHTLVLVLVFTTARNCPHGPHNSLSEPAGGNTTSGTVGCGDTNLISSAAWPLSAVQVLICGLARPTEWERWDTAMSDGIKGIRPGLLAVGFPTSTLGNF